jgi:hypothetical protein
VPVFTRVARLPHRALGVEGPTPRRAGVSPPRARRVARAPGRLPRGGVEPGFDSKLLDAVAT